MKRRDFVTQFIAASGVLLTGMKAMAQEVTARGVVVERPAPGTPHKNKVLLAVQAHSDDIPLSAAGDRSQARSGRLHRLPGARHERRHG